ncbi:hypothetical protein [Hydrogenophaga crassostreae]|uniref:Integrating conjugative element protein n=2 Tax=Hydrogenophaga crassostreae TaxID=1763535 RepID=A0A1D8P2G5_9BURK|nr:hypothetical protein [Hydrogenophaga crassostreae]AOW15582.1 hypothetical protein LPB072_11695 [Hydrogenophaga crassostreae]
MNALNSLGLRTAAVMTAVLMACALHVDAFAQARVINQTQEQQTQTGESSQQRLARLHSQLDGNDLLVAQIWGLSNEEMVRAKVLLKGPRAAFSVENLSPVEALGIHARDEKERVKYAEMFARALQADVERSLAWNRAFMEVQARLYPNQVVMDYSGQSPVAVPTATADMMGVPRTLVQDPAAARKSSATKKR